MIVFKFSKYSNISTVTGIVERNYITAMLHYTIIPTTLGISTFYGRLNEYHDHLKRYINIDVIYKKLRNHFNNEMFDEYCTVTYPFKHNIKQLKLNSTPKKSNYAINVTFNIIKSIKYSKNSLHKYFMHIINEIILSNAIDNSNYFEFINNSK